MFDFQDEVISFSVNQKLGIETVKSNSAVFAGKCCISSSIKRILQ